MGVGYTLINLDKKEQIAFYDIDCGAKHHEIISNPISSAIITHYLLLNSGDKIAFIDDTHGEFELFKQNYRSEDFKSYKDVTDVIVRDLVERNIFLDNGEIIIDAEDNFSVRDLKLIN